MKVLGVPEHASPEVKCQAVQKHPHSIEFFFCRRVERAAIHLFRKCLIADWIQYIYGFNFFGSAHAHGMMKLKLSPDILDMVKIFYAVNKATEMLECLIEFGQMSNEENLELSAAA